ncbi:hypothetical protein [Mesorhizobium sp. ES1-4]|uniref:hypothetical protein n=1 Tax=Mesorhizobium sp. ES1-4 TaxID=2876627 RepID=UPI001CCC3A65|nr:hypothetical protein [Mesorhizobium sp. ES1-4]MBZ9798725.1 hypothetical protein [Mesorhizobium sp. ES1-4]
MRQWKFGLWKDPDCFITVFVTTPKAVNHDQMTVFSNFGPLAQSLITGFDQAKNRRRPTRHSNDNDPLEADFQAMAGTQKANPFETGFGEPPFDEAATPGLRPRLVAFDYSHNAHMR